MENPPAYDDYGNNASWLTEKTAQNLGSKSSCRADDPEKDSSHHKSRLLLENVQHVVDRENMQLTTRGNSSLGSDYKPNINQDALAVTTRTPRSYFRPQATLDQPLILDLGPSHQGSLQDQELVTSNAQIDATLSSVQPSLSHPRPGESKDEQLAMVLSKHPEMDIDNVLKMLEAAELENCDQYPGPIVGNHCGQSNEAMSRGRIQHSFPSPAKATQPLARWSEMNPKVVDSFEARSKQQSYCERPTKSSINVTESISSMENIGKPRTLAEQEEEDFQLALRLSQQDVAQLAPRSSNNGHFDNVIATSSLPSGTTAIKAKKVTNREPDTGQQQAYPVMSSKNLPIHNTINNVTTSTRPSLLHTASGRVSTAPAKIVQPLPLFPEPTTSTQSLLSTMRGTPLSRNVEQQAISDSVAIHNLHAQRQADRILAERALINDIQSQSYQDRAAQAAIALAREDLADSRLETHMSNLLLSKQRVQDLRRHADEDELVRLQHQQEADLRRRQHMQESALRSQEASERARARDRRYQADIDIRREQEEADARFAMELDRMQHEQTLEKLDTFARAVDRPLRRAPIYQPRGEILEFSAEEGVAGGSRELYYESGYDDTCARTHCHGCSECIGSSGNYARNQ